MSTEESKDTLFLSHYVLEKTSTWLLTREIDIALDIEDLGDLLGLFVAVFGREPSPIYAPDKKP